MEKKVITTPIKTEDIKDLRVGDMIYLTGMMATCRDSGHARRVREGIIPEKYEFAGNAIFHAGPIVKKDEKTGKYTMVSVGPTTSMRMEAFEADFIEQTGVKIDIEDDGSVAVCGTDQAMIDKAVSIIKGIVTDIEPGLVGGTEFSNVRFKGDDAKAEKAYENTQALTPEDVTEAVWWVATLPKHVNINTLEMMPVSQSFAGLSVHRQG